MTEGKKVAIDIPRADLKRKQSEQEGVSFKRKCESKTPYTSMSTPTYSNMSGKENFEFFYGDNSPFSQHHPATFTIDGLKFNCAEQYMMYQKAVIFKDKEFEEKIMETSNPVMLKKCGRKVRNFDFWVWKNQSTDIVERANEAKFAQNPTLRKQLFATFPRLLVEASPWDTVWGIGLRSDNPLAWDMETWRGRNLLGHALTRVRDRLMKKMEGEREEEEVVNETKEKVLSKNKDMDEEIMRTDCPDKKRNQTKEQIKDSEFDTWTQHSGDVIKQGNMDKFSQNPNLKDQLSATSVPLIPESDPRDNTSIIGLDHTMKNDSSYQADRNRKRTSERHRNSDAQTWKRDSDSHWRDHSFDSRHRDNESRDGMRGGKERYRKDFSPQVKRQRGENYVSRETSPFNSYSRVFKHNFENLIFDHKNFEFFGYQSPFSQHYPVKFVIEEKEFNCAEQFCMYKKAVIFEDKEIEDKIMQCSDPKEQKKLGRNLKNFDFHKWMQLSVQVVRQGNMAKFSQNPDLKEKLFATFPRLLVEANGRDHTWGIGLHKYDPSALDMRTRRGGNLLGFIITEVREELMRKEPKWEKKLEEWKKREEERKRIRVKEGFPNEDGDDDFFSVDSRDDSAGASYSRWDSERYGRNKRGGWRERWDRDDVGRTSSNLTSQSRYSRRFGVPSQLYAKIANHDHKYKHYFDEENLISGQENFEFFFGWQSPFSQHHPVIFEIKGKEFNCAEQYYMYNKAVLFNDKEIEEQIMRSSDPKEQKRLGRKIKNFDFQTWMKQSVEVVKQGNLAKFSQNHKLKMQLFATAPKLMVEASPGDCTWGIGLHGDDPNAWDMRTWRGENLLGFTITEVREELMRQKKQQEMENEKKDKISSANGTQKHKNFDSKESELSSKCIHQDSGHSGLEGEVRDNNSKETQKNKSGSQRQKRQKSVNDKDESMGRHDGSSSNIKKKESDLSKKIEERQKERISKDHKIIDSTSSDNKDSFKETSNGKTKDSQTKDSKTLKEKGKRSDSKYPVASSSNDSEVGPTDKNISHNKKEGSKIDRKDKKRNKKDESRGSSSSEINNNSVDESRSQCEEKESEQKKHERNMKQDRRSSKDGEQSPLNSRGSHPKKRGSKTQRKEKGKIKRLEHKRSSLSDSEGGKTNEKTSDQITNDKRPKKSNDSPGMTEQDTNRNTLGNNSSDKEDDHHSSNEEQTSSTNPKESKSTSPKMFKHEEEDDTNKNHDEDNDMKEKNRDVNVKHGHSSNEEFFDIERSEPEMITAVESLFDSTKLHQVGEQSNDKRMNTMNCEQNTQKICEDEEEGKGKDDIDEEGTFKRREKEFVNKISKRNYRKSKSFTKDSESETIEPNKCVTDRDSETDVSQKDRWERNGSLCQRDNSDRTENKNKSGLENKKYGKDMLDTEDRRTSKDRHSRSRKDSFDFEKHLSKQSTERSKRWGSSVSEKRRHSVGSVHRRDCENWSRKEREDRQYSVGSDQKEDREDTHQQRSRKDGKESSRYKETSLHRKHSLDSKQNENIRVSVESWSTMSEIQDLKDNEPMDEEEKLESEESKVDMSTNAKKKKKRNKKKKTRKSEEDCHSEVKMR